MPPPVGAISMWKIGLESALPALADRPGQLYIAINTGRVFTADAALIFQPSSLNPRGAWSSSAAYKKLDLAKSGGAQWLALRPNTNITPVEGLDWTLFIDKGDQGPPGASGASTAAQVTNTPAGNIAATNVQAALNELDTEKASAQSLTDHLNDTSDAHDASAISYGGATGIAATDAEGAIDELAGEKLDISAHTRAAHDTLLGLGQASGYAPLDSGNKVPAIHMPTLAINEVFQNIATQSAMLALTAQRGDVAIRTDFDPDRMYMLSTDDPTQVANWVRVTFGDVVSVFGRTGVVTAQAGDYTATQITNTPAGNIAATTVQAALNELDGEKATAQSLTDHLNDTVDAHDASAISYLGSTSLSATDLEAGLDELDLEKFPFVGGTLTGPIVLNADGTVALHPISLQQWQAKAMKDPVTAATTAALPANTRSANVLTASANGALPAQDGITLVANNSLFVKDEATGVNKGLYTVTNAGSAGAAWVLTRRVDADTSAKIANGLIVQIAQGTTLGGKFWRMTNTSAPTLNTTALTFAPVPTDWADLTSKPSTFSPSAHASSHQPGGADAMAVDAAAATGSLRTLGTNPTQAAAGDDTRLSDTRTPTDGTVTDAKVAPGAAIAESKLSLASDAAAGTASRRTLGTNPTQAAAGNDARLSDARTPTAHAHAAADITSGLVATARLGSGASASTFLRGDQTYAVPTSVAVGAFDAFKVGSQVDIPLNTPTKVTFENTGFNLSSWFDLANDRYLPLLAGYYELGSGVGFASSVDQKIIKIEIYKNGAFYRQLTNLHTSGTAAITGNSAVPVIFANGTTDYFEIYVTQSSAATGINISSGWFAGRFVGA